MGACVRSCDSAAARGRRVRPHDSEGGVPLHGGNRVAARYSGFMARRDITMTPEEILTFLAEPRNLEVATVGQGGWPHLAPMWYVLDGGKVVFRSFTKSQKIVNLQRDPRLTVLAEDGLAYEELRGVMIKGEAELVTDRDYVLGLYGRLTARYAMVPGGAALDGEALEAAFGRFAEKNTAVLVHPVSTVSWDHTKLGGAY